MGVGGLTKRCLSKHLKIRGYMKDKRLLKEYSEEAVNERVKELTEKDE